MERFKLRTWCSGFEVPFFDMEDSSGVTELSSSLHDHYLNWFDVLKSELYIIDLPNTNIMILYSIIIRVDSDLVNQDTMEEEWKEFQSNIEKSLKDFLKIRNLEYRQVTL